MNLKWKKPMTGAAGIAVAPMAGWLVAGAAAVSPALADDREPSFDPITVIDRAFPAITDPPLMGAREAESSSVVRDEELVLGVVVGEEARAYPINQLTGPRREIINDALGGRAIAATW